MRHEGHQRRDQNIPSDYRSGTHRCKDHNGLKQLSHTGLLFLCRILIIP